jgi:hypothetical protein
MGLALAWRMYRAESEAVLRIQLIQVVAGVGWLLGAAAVGCSNAVEAPFETTNDPMTGPPALANTTNFLATGYLQKLQGEVEATATLFRQDLALSAAHAFDLPQWEPTLMGFRGLDTGAETPVITAVQHFRYDGDGGNDMAVVVLSRARSNISVARLPTASLSLSANCDSSVAPRETTYSVVGYGLTTPPGQAPLIGQPLNERRVASSCIVDVNPRIGNVEMRDPTGSSGLCYGDSGGPLMSGSTILATLRGIRVNNNCAPSREYFGYSVRAGLEFIEKAEQLIREWKQSYPDWAATRKPSEIVTASDYAARLVAVLGIPFQGDAYNAAVANGFIPRGFDRGARINREYVLAWLATGLGLRASSSDDVLDRFIDADYLQHRDAVAAAIEAGLHVWSGYGWSGAEDEQADENAHHQLAFRISGWNGISRVELDVMLARAKRLK